MGKLLVVGSVGAQLGWGDRAELLGCLRGHPGLPLAALFKKLRTI